MSGIFRYEQCPEMFGPNADRLCVRCGGTLTGRQISWCSKECVAFWVDNHWFNSARRAAIRAAKDDDGALKCAICEGPIQPWDDREVDHIERARGTHSKPSCVHHVSNLRVLHVACHLEVTREQRAQDARKRREGAL